MRKDLSSEQRLIYLLLIWFIPFGWIIYFLLGEERTQQLFADLEFFD
ncbi:MAG: PLDc N-terminal domain-containing protein [Candidatus Nanohaloarchaea archaeon]